ncbi:MAG: 16S rRNA (guanine(527)-N(7))-methyltransferase RsmG [Nitrospirota bacterium]
MVNKKFSGEKVRDESLKRCMQKNLKPDELLKKGAEMLGLSLKQNQIDLFMIYLTEIKKWNRTYNLTGLKTDSDIVIKHFLDSLSFLIVLPLKTRVKVIDIGTGAGFPGIPLKIYLPAIELILVDSTLKKILFLKHILRCLSLQNVAVLHERAERLSLLYPNTFDIVISRALFKTSKLISIAIPLLKKDGIIAISRGIKEPIEDLTTEIKESGGVIKNIKEITLPFSEYRRRLLLIQYLP